MKVKGCSRLHRNRLRIVADMLKIAEKGARKTRIMYLGNLSYELLEKYLDALLASSLIEMQSRSSKTYVVTEKGRRFLEYYYKLQEHLQIAEAKKRTLERSLLETLTSDQRTGNC